MFKCVAINSITGGVSMKFKKVKREDLRLNPITMFADDWPLLTAGNKKNGYNTMTIAWGHIGAIWNKPTMVVYVRPQRYTKEFMDCNELFTVSVLSSEYKEALTYLGTTSGRDEDKVAKVGITPVFDDDATYFEEAKMVFICRIIYEDPIIEYGFLKESFVYQMYPEKDFHAMYIGEIVEILIRS